jgi:hypothetical protein
MEKSALGQVFTVLLHFFAIYSTEFCVIQSLLPVSSWVTNLVVMSDGCFESLDNFYKTAESGSNLTNDYEVHEYLRNLVFKAYHHIRFVLCF